MTAPAPDISDLLDQLRTQLLEVVKERNELREMLRLARTVISAENRYKTWNKELAQIDAVLNDQKERSE